MPNKRKKRECTCEPVYGGIAIILNRDCPVHWEKKKRRSE